MYSGWDSIMMPSMMRKKVATKENTVQQMEPAGWCA